MSVTSQNKKLDRQRASNKIEDWHSLKFTKHRNNFSRMGYMKEGETERGREETGGGSDLLLSTTKDNGLSVL